MTNLKNKILNALNSDTNLEPILEEIAKYQNKILANYTNSLYDLKNQTKIFNKYNDAKELGQALYRYDTLNKNNYTIDALREKEKIKKLINILDKEEDDDNNKRVCFPKYPLPKSPLPSPKPKPLPEPPPTTSSERNWILPVSKGHQITSGYGNRMHPIHNRIIFHDGIDINAQMNTQVYAVADGKVVKAEWFNGYGNYIEIDHGNELHSFYAHLNTLDVNKGDIVKQGQIIAKSGNTGAGTAAHLHFGTHKNGQRVNPLNYLPSF